MAHDEAAVAGTPLSHQSSGSGSSSTQSDVGTCQQIESDFDKLPVDIIRHIHSLLPLQDAASAACVSREFLRSWRCYSNLTLSRETLGLTRKKSGDTNTFFIDIVDHILKMHSGTGVDIFKLDLSCENVDASKLNRWLQISRRWGIKELCLAMPLYRKKEYIFPCSVLSDDAAVGSVELLTLKSCQFHPTTELGSLRRLRKLRLFSVNITDEGLRHLLSKSLALERMEIFGCRKIISLSLPCTLQKLKFLRVVFCLELQSVDINAPQLSSFHCFETQPEYISVADPWQLTDVIFSSSRLPLSFAPARLLPVARNVETLTLFSLAESINASMLISKFPCLKKLKIKFQRSLPAFDVMSLISFLDASPSLDSFSLHVGHALRPDDSVVAGDGNYLRWKPQCRHAHLRQVIITGFCSDKKLIQFVIYILENAPSLESLTLDTLPSYSRQCGTTGKNEKCYWMNEARIAEALTELLRLRKDTSRREFLQVLDSKFLSPVAVVILADGVKWMWVCFVLS